VISTMRDVEGVLDVHDLHIWSLGSSTRALSCHVTIADIPASASDVVLRRLNHVLAERFHIFHSTVQFEHLSCAISENGLRHPVSAEGHAGTSTSLNSEAGRLVSGHGLSRAADSAHSEGFRWNEKAGLPAGCDMLPLRNALEVQRRPAMRKNITESRRKIDRAAVSSAGT